jgi:casein kinase 1
LGISLEEFLVLRQGSISVGTVKKIGSQLLTKIRVMHSKNIVHNDIKPGNILFGVKERRNEVFLVDFGLSELSDKSEDGEKS